MDTLPSPTPTPTKSLSTFNLDTLSSSIEYPRLAPTEPVAHKNQFLNDFATKLSQNIESQKSRFAKKKMADDQDVMDITETSDIIRSQDYDKKTHNALSSLPDNPVNKLLSNAVSASTHQLNSLKLENKSLRAKIEQLQKTNAQLAQSKSKTNDEILISVNESLVKKVKKYKSLSESQAQTIQELKERLKLSATPVEIAQVNSTDDTEMLLNNNNKENTKNATPNPNIQEIRQEMQEFITQVKQLVQKQDLGPEYNIDSANVASVSEHPSELDQLQNIEKEVARIMASLSKITNSQISFVKNTSQGNSESNNSLNNVVKNTVQEKVVKNSIIDAKQNPDIFIVEDILQKFIKRKQLEKELDALQNDENIKLIDEIINPSKTTLHPHNPVKFSSDPTRRSEIFNPLASTNHFKRPGKSQKVDLNTLRSLRSSNAQESNDTWLEDLTELEPESNLDDVYESLKNEYLDMISQYKSLSNEALSSDVNTNYRANKRSIELLQDLLKNINRKRQEIYKLAHVIGKDSNDISHFAAHTETDPELLW